ncbi:hypothetical protein [Leucobacter tenebrionis]|uniref:hypothetical protein n=1 Tax=Leucobacter tenebrionis TaxID=2873270 RepID=UPI001CA655D8|nr:hypothetical protein [Leucobacter tenebrionis]QZY52898.1 hypothetical protein KVY00_05545 [Leucobacter tenebrionis]
MSANMTPAQLDAEHRRLEHDYRKAVTAYEAAEERLKVAATAFRESQCKFEIRWDGVLDAFDSVITVTLCTLRKGHSGEHRNTFADREATR